MIDFVACEGLSSNSDLLSGLERLYSDRNGVNISRSTIAALAGVSIPSNSFIFRGNDSPLGVTSTGSRSVPEEVEKHCGKLREPDDIVHKSAEDETTLLGSDSSRTLSKQCLDKRTTQTTPTNPVAHTKIILYPPLDSVEQNSCVSCEPGDACLKSCVRVCCEEEEKDEVDSGGSDSISLNKLLPTDSQSYTIDIRAVSEQLQGDHRNPPQQLCNAENDVPDVFHRPCVAADPKRGAPTVVNPRSPVARFAWGLPHGIYRPVQGLYNLNRRDERGVWWVVNTPLQTDLEGEYNSVPVGSEVTGFLPIPGDIMITEKPRSPFLESYLQPNPGGNTTVFVDRAFFERTQTIREEIEYKMQEFFSENDMIVRFGRFNPGWIWTPQKQIEFFIFRGKRNGKGKWYLHGRLRNVRKMAPPDERFENAHVYLRRVPHHPEWGNFLPRDTDIVIRPSTDEVWQPFDDELEKFEFVDADLVLRVSIMKSQNPWKIFTADLYMLETTVIHGAVRVSVPKAVFPDVIPPHLLQPTADFDWVFRGRDIQMFGPPQPDTITGKDLVLDLNGPEPHVPRPIPHWGLHEFVWGARPPPGHPP